MDGTPLRTRQLGDLRRRLAHHRRVDGPVGPEQESGQLVGLLFVQEVAALALHLGPDVCSMDCSTMTLCSEAQTVPLSKVLDWTMAATALGTSAVRWI